MLNHENQSFVEGHVDRGTTINRLHYDGEYSSENGVADIYPGIAEEIRNAMAHEDSFVFEGHSRHSDTIYYRVEKTKDEYRITVSDFIEQDEDLIAEAIHALGRAENVLSVEQRDTILQSMKDSNITSEAKVAATLPLSCSYEDIIERLDLLWKEANGNLEKQFAKVKNMVEGYLSRTK